MGKFLASVRGAGFFCIRQGTGFYFQRRKVQTSGPQAVNSEPSLSFNFVIIEDVFILLVFERKFLLLIKSIN